RRVGYKESLEGLEGIEQRRSAEITSLKSQLKSKENELKKLGDNHKLLKEKYKREMSSREKFLTSKEGKSFKVEVEEKAVATYKASSDFDDVATERALILYNDIAHDYRWMLWKSGRVFEDIIMLIEPRIPELSVDADVEDSSLALVVISRGEPPTKVVDAVSP
ncbi:hypothetical protein Pfo_018925, partial [Paulownia fortunei]